MFVLFSCLRSLTKQKSN